MTSLNNINSKKKKEKLTAAANNNHLSKNKLIKQNWKSLNKEKKQKNCKDFLLLLLKI